jgi:peptide/nickel transport system permease protein
MRKLWIPGSAVLLIVLIAVAAPILPMMDPIRQDVANRLAPYVAGSPAGAGRVRAGRAVAAGLGRAVLARRRLRVDGPSRPSSARRSACLGGWFRGLAEVLAIRGADVVLCFPPVLLALLVVTLLGPGTGTLILVLSVLYLPGFIRVSFAEVLSARSQDYVEAVRALGARTPRILLRTVLPNIAGPVLVQVSLAVASAVVLESGLSFLGLGVVPPTPSWGTDDPRRAGHHGTGADAAALALPGADGDHPGDEPAVRCGARRGGPSAAAAARAACARWTACCRACSQRSIPRRCWMCRG